jgi:hypothetical protein
LNHQKASCVLALVLLPAGLGCSLEEVDSDAIRTKGIYAEMLAIAPGDGQTLVRVNLTVGGNSGTRVHLTGNDTLVAEAGDDVQELGRRGSGQYEVSLVGEASRDITVRLERGEEDDAAQGTAPLPEPFGMRLETASAGGINRSTPAIVSWQDPSLDDASLDWSLDGDCIWPDSGVTPDDGVMTLQTDSVQVRPTHVGEECEVRLTLDRVIQGEVDSLFVPGSSFRAIQRRAVTFVSTPAVGEKNGPAAAVGTGTATQE